MTKKEEFSNNALSIFIEESEDIVNMHWEGKSTDRNPGMFLSPILLKALNKSTAHNKKLVIDFKAMHYMNSSTITPISKIIEMAKSQSARVFIVYDKDAKWQELCFSALKIFETKDENIKIIGN